MVQIQWQGGELEVRRIVLSEATPRTLAGTIRRLASGHGLVVAGPAADALPGDLWIGCLPPRGWSDVEARDAGWVRAAEIYLAIAQLRRAVTTTRPDWVSVN